MAAAKILVIGGSGFVSGTLARTARDQGHEIWIVTRGQKPHPEWRFFLCQRIYDLTPPRLDGLKAPNTPLREGLRAHMRSA